MSSNRYEFDRDKIDVLLKEVAKEYRRLAGKKMPAEIILIGGASALINYGFRNLTEDIDAILLGSGAMKDAIAIIRDRYGLPGDWLNDDFKKTASYTPKISQYSQHYENDPDDRAGI